MTNVALTGIARDLAKRASEGRPVRIGVIGSGEMGTDLVTQGMLMPGIAVCAVSTRRPHTCLLYTSPSPRDGLLSRMPSSA